VKRGSEYRRDKSLLDELSLKVRRVMLDRAADPDEEIPQSELALLIQKGALSQNQAFLVYSLFH